ncbi:MAG: hypothetical protein PHO37_10550 [Kiritimatiellae bacterium]|nr:hypothetical protein [Kiritimatiellia bacterium]
MKQLAYAGRLSVKGAPWDFRIFVWLDKVRSREVVRYAGDGD